MPESEVLTFDLTSFGLREVEDNLESIMERLGSAALTRARFDEAEELIARLPQIDLPITHEIEGGIYKRQIYVPAGILLTSVLHFATHHFVLLQGEISMWTPQSGVVRLKAPFSCVTQPGTRRIVYHHTDTIVCTFHATDLEDPEDVLPSVADCHPNPRLGKEFVPACLRR